MMTFAFPLNYTKSFNKKQTYSYSKDNPLNITFLIAPALFSEQIGVKPRCVLQTPTVPAFTKVSITKFVYMYIFSYKNLQYRR